jgi:hypothetical protein
MSHIPHEEQFAHAEIKALMAKYLGAERRLTDQLADAYKRGVDRGVSLSERELANRARARAGQLLDGSPIDETVHVPEAKPRHAKRSLSEQLLPPEKDLPEPGVQHLHIERAAIRMILEALTRRNIEAEAAEALRHAEEVRPEYNRLLREWALALARFTSVDERLQGWWSRIGSTRSALPAPWTVDHISFGGWVSVREVLEGAIADGLVTEAEVRKAQRGQGDT